MPTAIVAGATGITGAAIVDALVADPSYTHIYTLSRSQQRPPHPKISHATLDLQSSAADMAKDLAEVKGSVVFICAYMARDDEAEAARVNRAMLQNLLDALRLTGALAAVERIVLTCGLKQYGVHLGETKQPMREDDAGVPLVGVGWPPNFYYDQQDVLAANTGRDDGGATYTWTVTMPQDVIGFVRGNFMNEATALGLYAAVSRRVEGQRGELPFPGSRANYLAFNCWTSADLHARFCLWAAGEPRAANQCFNVVNGDTESWTDLWPRVTERFGCVIPPDMFAGAKPGEYGYTYGDFESAGPQKLHDPAPVSVQAEVFGMAGYGKEPSTLYQMVDTVKWARNPKVVKAWESLRDKYGLDQSAWDKATWSFLTFVLGREWSCVTSMSKARSMGWTGYQGKFGPFLLLPLFLSLQNLVNYC